MVNFKPSQKTNANLYRRYRLRLFILIGFLSIIFSILIYRSIVLVFYSPIPASHMNPDSPIRRGLILDNQGHELAVSRDTASIAVRPGEIVDVKTTSTLLAQKLDQSPQEVFNKITNSDKKYLYISRRVEPNTVQEIKALHLSGVIFEKEPDRYYPNQRLASGVLGFVGDGNMGLEGIEYQFNSELITSSVRNDIGDNLHLSINSYIQYQLEKTLQKEKEKTNAKGAIGVIAEVNTGRILAMASLPNFNPNEPSKFSTEEKRNRAITDVYEPGSTFKMFTLAALAGENLLEEERTYFCPGHFSYKGVRVRCSGVHNEQNLRQVIQNSCNTGVIDASWKLPVLRFHETLRSFGFGSLTEIGLPGEARGHLPAPKNWDLYLKMTIPIGHGISASALQMIMAANALANGGHVMRPILVDKLTDNDGKLVKEFKPKVRMKLSRTGYGEKIRKYLEAVTSKGGTGTLATLHNYPFKVCGKTGTSIKSNEHGYMENVYQASFLGFFPCENPEISILIMFDEPQGKVYQGGQIAAPVFRKVLEETIPIVHSGEVVKVLTLPKLIFSKKGLGAGVMPELQGRSKKEVLRILSLYYPGEHSITGAGYLKTQTPKAGNPIAPPYSFTLHFGFFPGQ